MRPLHRAERRFCNLPSSDAAIIPAPQRNRSSPPHRTATLYLYSCVLRFSPPEKPDEIQPHSKTRPFFVSHQNSAELELLCLMATNLLKKFMDAFWSSIAFAIFSWTSLDVQRASRVKPTEGEHFDAIDVRPDNEDVHDEPEGTGNGEIEESTDTGIPSPFSYIVDFKAYTLQEIVAATDNFDRSRLLGEGSNGQVFHGVIDGLEIVVKRLPECACRVAEEKQEFLKEIRRIAAVNHKSILELKGFCLEGDSPLLISRKLCSLDEALYCENPQNILSWDARFKLAVAVDVAQALAYLHGGTRHPMVHCDVKPGNILFDAQTVRAYLADFGLVHLVAQHQSVARDEEIEVGAYYGTKGYRAPEVRSRKRLSIKSDVYSFGKVLYALVSGKRDVETIPQYLVRRPESSRRYVGRRCRNWFVNLLFQLPLIRIWLRPCILDVVDWRVQEEVRKSGRAIIQVATTAVRWIAACAQETAKEGPNMENVAMALENANFCKIPWSVAVSVKRSIWIPRLLSLLLFVVSTTASILSQGTTPAAVLLSIAYGLQLAGYALGSFGWFSSLSRMDKLVYWNAEDDTYFGL